MRLPPIEKPRSLFLKLVYFFSRRTFGKVITPLKIVYARSPALLSVSLKIQKTEKKLRLNPEAQLLIKTFVARLNDCKFCTDIASYFANKEGFEAQKMRELLGYRMNDKYSESEKAMLAYAEEVTLNKNADDETFARLKKHFSEREIVEITWMVAVEHYYNLLAKPLGIESDDLA